ncbi:MAG: hypothetical protein Q8L87_01145 [Anaerolineales bacterium]|jgi:multisubunit Na+/H+ antiporter MnhB subunit|nr:hypothetical protein [Anaerolineales bacterium]
MKSILLLSLVVLVIAIGLLYMEYENNPVKKMEVRGGSITGNEMGFLEARSAALSSICVTWLIVLIVAGIVHNRVTKS